MFSEHMTASDDEDFILEEKPSTFTDNVLQRLSDLSSGINHLLPKRVSWSSRTNWYAARTLKPKAASEELQGNNKALAAVESHTASSERKVAEAIPPSAKSRITASEKGPRSLLHVACSDGLYEVASLLLQSGESVDSADMAGRTPLHLACAHGSTDLVQLLLSKGASVSHANVWGEGPLHVASEHGHEQVAAALLNRDATVDALDVEGETPLFKACCYGHKDVASLLLERGAEVDKADKRGNTPMHVACKYGWNAGIVFLLLQHGACINKTNNKGSTPLDNAYAAGHSDVQDLLKRNGAKSSNRWMW